MLHAKRGERHTIVTEHRSICMSHDRTWLHVARKERRAADKSDGTFYTVRSGTKIQQRFIRVMCEAISVVALCYI